jgi:hypothetical protein
MEEVFTEHTSPVLEKLHEDFGTIHPFLLKLSKELRDERISKYPIYIAQMQSVDLGRPIPIFEQLTLHYHYNASFLEEFVKKDIIPMAKVNIFREAYKHPEKYACFFMVTPLEAGFIYIPYRESEVE